MRNRALEKAAVKKVKLEVDSIIDHARERLQAYAEDESDLEILKEVSQALVQVERTLQLVQINGAAVLAREMGEVVKGLLDDSISQAESALECLSRGIIQMSDYLEYVQAGHKDVPVVLLPLLNDLRGVREAPLLSEHFLFFPNFDDIDVPNVPIQIGMQPQEFAKKIRYGYQLGLVNLIQNKELDDAARKMCKVAIRLHQCTKDIAGRRLWWITSAVVQAIAIHSLERSTGLASLLGQVDQQIKKFIEMDDANFSSKIPNSLIKNLLYYVGISKPKGRIVTKVKNAYSLDELIPDQTVLENMREGIAGPNMDVLSAVSQALNEDMANVKDSIELYVHSKNRSPESVNGVAEELQKIADTLSMLGLDEPREEVMRDVVMLKGLSAEELEHADSNFVQVAETLIKAETIVDNFVNYRLVNKPVVQLVGDDETDEDKIEKANQLRKVQIQTLSEALDEIEEAKNKISILLSTPEDTEKLVEIQEHFRRITGALSVLNLGDVVKILESLQAYLIGNQVTEELSSQPEKLDAFADTITSIECYVEAVISEEESPNEILKYGIDNVSKLVDCSTIDFETENSAKKKFEITESNSSEETPPDAPALSEEEMELEDFSATALNQPLDMGLFEEGSPSSEEVKPESVEKIQAPEEIQVSEPEVEIPPVEQKQEVTAPEPSSAEATAMFEPELEITEDADATALFTPEMGAELDEYELSQEIAELESTSISEAEEELNTLAEGIKKEDREALEIAGQEVGVIEVDADEASSIELEDIEQELNTDIKNLDLNKQVEENTKDTHTSINLDEIQESVNEEVNSLVESDKAFVPPVDDSVFVEESSIEELPSEILPINFTITVNDDDEQKQLMALREAVDQEIMEIFLEEATEELEKISLNLSIWREDVNNKDALTIVRRSFHTLKGSGRLISAEIFGEFSWQIENILNKVIDNVFEATEELFELIDNSANLLEQLLTQLKTQRHPEADLSSLYSVAQNYIKNRKEQNSKKTAEQESITDDSEEDDEFDSELHEIYLSEATQHIETLEAAVEKSCDTKRLKVNDDLIQALHTLFGASRTAHVDAIGKLAAALEQYFIECNVQGQKIEAEKFEAFESAVQIFRTVVTEYRDDARKAKLDNELLEKINQFKAVEIPVLKEEVSEQDSEHKIDAEDAAEKTVLESAIFAVPENIDLYEDKDAELVEIFLEEASDLLMTCNECLEKWISNKKDQDAIAEFQRQLHTLKGSARMAAYSNIGDFSHAVESIVIATSGGDIEANENTFSVIQRCLDTLNDMVDDAQAHQPVHPATKLLAELDALRGIITEVEPTGIQEQSLTQQELKVLTEIQETEKTEKEVVKIPVLRTVVGKDEPAKSQANIPAQQSVRLQSDILDNLVNNAGEVNIFQGRLEQVGNKYTVNIKELEQVVDRLRDQLRSLEIETETQILSQHAHESPDLEDFDPLELDRYSNIQQLSRSLAESVNDLLSIKEILSEQVRESDMLLAQQRRTSADLQEGLMRTRMVPFNQLVPRMQRIIRQTSRELNKEANLKVIGADTEIDSSILNRIVAPLEHLLRNAISHGIEEQGQRVHVNKAKEGEVSIQVKREGAEIIIKVTDDGAGIEPSKVKQKGLELGLISEDKELPDHELINLILTPGFSTAGTVSQVSGRGVGMDVVASELKQLGGSLQIDSALGQGTTFIIRIPITLAITQALLVRCGNDIFAVPLVNVEGVVRLSAHELKQKYAEKSASYHYADKEYRLNHLGSLLGVCSPQLDGADKMFPVLLVRSGDSRLAIHVESTLGNREIVIKPLASQLSRLPAVSGATILGDGEVVLILDMQGLIRLDSFEHLKSVAQSAEKSASGVLSTILVVDDSITIRKVTTRFLERNDYAVVTAKDGVDAMQKLQEFTPTLILLDIEMPRMDGYELATHVKNNARLQEIPIIMITSRTGEKHRQRALDIGVQKYLGKPYNEAELLENIKTVLH